MANSDKSKDLSDEEILKIYKSFPDEAKALMAGSKFYYKECHRTSEKYGMNASEKYGMNACSISVNAVMLGIEALDNLPSSIEEAGKVERRVALQAAIRVSRHILKPFSQYVDIGNVDAYIEDWNKELSQIQNSINSLKGGEKMSKRLEDLVDIANPQQPHCATILLLDTSGSMDGEKIAALNEGIKTFKEAIIGNPEKNISSDDLARKRIDLAVVAFNDTVQVLHNFSTVEDFDPPTLSAGGYTAMGDAILKASVMIEERKQQYKQKGIDYYRPWIFMITDGEPTDMQPGDEKWNNVIKAVHDGETNKKFMFFGIAVEPANTELLRQITPPNRPAVRLRQGRFRELFQWLSKSQSRVSSSNPGEQVKIDDPVTAGWGEVSV